MRTNVILLNILKYFNLKAEIVWSHMNFISITIGSTYTHTHYLLYTYEIFGIFVSFVGIRCVETAIPLVSDK